ncbi:hypothetical protein CEXT_387431 [Caerostris extrusa]|uniref:Uncharacterized protein n=1 Tax=Caerostris extrusa TaxID=172846 RepID=A0AAV4P3W0_CAEEX|nr:hypothetical protein CEXT_387431 [Caerostris extrusa]
MSISPNQNYFSSTPVAIHQSCLPQYHVQSSFHETSTTRTKTKKEISLEIAFYFVLSFKCLRDILLLCLRGPCANINIIPFLLPPGQAVFIFSGIIHNLLPLSSTSRDKFAQTATKELRMMFIKRGTEKKERRYLGMETRPTLLVNPHAILLWIIQLCHVALERMRA